MDHDDWDLVTEAFHAAARAEYSDLGAHEGREAIVEGLREPLKALDVIYHQMTNHRAIVSGDTARVEAYVSTTCVRKGAPGGDMHLYGGAYDNDMVLTPTGWKIKTLRYQRLWEHGNTSLIAG